MRADVDERARETLESVFRRERPQILAVLIRLTGDFTVAEDVLQEAFTEALTRWPVDGVPPRPGAWIAVLEQLIAADSASMEATVSIEGEDGVPHDDRLRLLFTCCHPALSHESQVALTLRMVAGLNTREIARAFLAGESTMAQRIVRAKQKIRDAQIPFRVPAAADLPHRLDAVLAIIYLVFNEGYVSSGESALVRDDMCNEAIRLGRLLNQLLPAQPDVEGLLALMLLTSARRAARTGPLGELITLDRQDRSLWDRALISEGCALVETALRRGRVGAYQIQAAIAALHAEAGLAERTDWAQIAALYALLLRIQPNAVVKLNHAVAVGMASGPAAGLAMIDDLDARGELRGYHLLSAARAELLVRSGNNSAAESSFRRAIQECASAAERDHLKRRLGEVAGTG